MDATTGLDAAADAAVDARTDATIREAGAVDASTDGSDISALVCPPAERIGTGCLDLGGLNEGSADVCDGLDNNCNGLVDEGCGCTPGDVQPCFAGPPARARVGACQFGTQVCEGFEFPTWGACTGGIVPSDEQCDGLDNDCNGCVDEAEQCVNLVDCPSPGDPRVPNGQPFSTYTFNADDFVDPQFVEAYRWQVQGTPCDRMFSALPGGATSTNGRLSYTLRNRTSATPSVDLTLSGEYAVTMEVDLKNGQSVSCNFPLKVGTRGLRVELCWPESGPNSPRSGEVDLDLHLGRADLTENWNDDNDCYWNTCKTLKQQFSGTIWDYSPSNVGFCTGPGATDGTNDLATECHNPRLDVDSQDVADSRYPTENINTERARSGESFRVAVVNFECSEAEDCRGRVAHPLVNVYCDSTLQGSYRLAPGEVDSFGAGNGGDPIDGPRDVWRVVDVATTRRNGALRCQLTPLTAEDGGPWIEAGPGGTLPY